MVSVLVLGIMAVGSLLGALGTLSIKKGTTGNSLLQLFRTRRFLWGFFLLIISTVLYFFALRQEELSVLYPLVSLTYVWTTLLSIKYLGERMNGWKWLGLFGILLGVVFIGLGS